MARARRLDPAAYPRAARLALATVACLVVASSLVPRASASGPAPPRLSARAAELVVAGTGQELYGYGENRRLAIASATKLMTALVTLERAPLHTVFAQNNYYSASVDSQIGLTPGERMTVHDLLLAMLLPSADDAAEDLAYNVGRGSVARFVAMMNARAAQLGLAHTHYSTPIGLDTPGNYSSAADLAKLAAFLLAHHPFFARAVALPSARLKTGPVRRVRNRNDLVGRVPWITGVKTGHTLDAGYVLVGSGARDGLSLISVVLGTPSETLRDRDTLALLGYGLAGFHSVTPVVAGTVLARPSVQDQQTHAQLIAASTFTRVLSRATRVHLRVQAPRQLTGPLARGAQIGSVTVVADGRPIARIPLLLAHALPAVSSLTRAGAFLLRASTLLPLILLLGAAGAAVVFRRQRSRAKAAAASR
jgi:D-alanyl-D-alanine carboxypeptidase (penicillin-binding protein 5/6)